MLHGGLCHEVGTEDQEDMAEYWMDHRAELGSWALA